MPDEPLRLISGGDHLLRRLRLGLAGLAAVGFLISLWPLPARIGGVVAAISLLLAGEARARRTPIRRLVLFPDGHGLLDGAAATLEPGGWLTGRYAVLRLRSEGRRRQILISASRQTGDEYRKLLAWMRLRTWTSH